MIVMLKIDFYRVVLIPFCCDFVCQYIQIINIKIKIFEVLFQNKYKGPSTIVVILGCRWKALVSLIIILVSIGTKRKVTS